MKPFQLYNIPFGTTKFYCDLSKTHPHRYIPSSIRGQVFQHFHNLSHPGKRETVKLIAECFVWLKMNMDIHNWTKTCIPCQKNKIHRHTESPLGTFSTPDARFTNVHINLAGPLSTSKWHTHIFTTVDRFSIWLTTIAVKDTSATTIARVILQHWIAIFGVPSVITVPINSFCRI